ncbi:MAG TPA: hypothetical protein VG722_03415, partial [Tepidisphaeraceae bacterium]|nr:hypothetical protein [Tepidisphaeraceae bacterium]
MTDQNNTNRKMSTRTSRFSILIQVLLLALVPLLTGGCTAMSHFFGIFTRKSPQTLVRMIDNSEFPDKRREGINGLVEYKFARHPPYTTRYEQIAQLDPDFTVRSVAIR